MWQYICSTVAHVAIVAAHLPYSMFSTMWLNGTVSSAQLWEEVAVAFGILFLCAAFQLSLSTLSFLYVYFVRPPLNPRNYGTWAVVTGASEGIGRAYAELLASKGMESLICSRKACCS